MQNKGQDHNPILEMRIKGTGMEKDGQYWSKEDRKQLEIEFYKGTGVSIIAIQLQRSERAVMQQILLENFYEDTMRRRRSRNRKKKKCCCGKCAKQDTCPHSPKNRGDGPNA